MIMRVAFVARQAGSAAAFVPLIHALQKQNSPPCVIFGLEQASSIFTNAGINHHCVKDFAAARADLITARPNILITGTSFSAAEDYQFWNWARISRISSVAFVDHWINYPQRFSSSPNHLFDCLPGYIAVIDQRMRQEICAVGAPESRIIVLGHPGWDRLSVWRGQRAPELKKQLAGERKLILFISEPIAEFYGASLGYTENDALLLLRNTLATLDGNYIIAVKPHPRQNPQNINLPEDTANLQMRIVTEGHWELLAAADIVTGMNSMLLYEATIMGRPVIALQPGRIAENLIESPGMIIVSHPTQAISAIKRALDGEIELLPQPVPALPCWINWLNSNGF